MTADAVGGVWTFVIELAAVLAERGVSVLVAVMGPSPSPGQRAEAAAIPGLLLADAPFRLEWMDEPWDDVERAGEWLLRLEWDFSPDVVQVNGYVHGALPWRAPCVVVGHSCVLSWWRSVRGEEAPSSWDRYRRSVAAGVRGAGFVTAPTRWMLDSLRDDYGPLPQARVIPNARSGRLFRPLRKKTFAVAAGRLWDEAKNVAGVVAAGALPWPVFVAGEGEESRSSGGAHFLGKLPPRLMPALLGSAGIFVHPARYEPFGLAVLEAALCATPLVLGDIPTLRENWDGASLFVDPSDAAALREALLRLMMEKDLRDDLAAKALQRSTAFTPEKMADGYLAAYDALLDGGAGKESACGS